MTHGRTINYEFMQQKIACIIGEIGTCKQIIAVSHQKLYFNNKIYCTAPRHILCYTICPSFNKYIKWQYNGIYSTTLGTRMNQELIWHIVHL